MLHVRVLVFVIENSKQYVRCAQRSNIAMYKLVSICSYLAEYSDCSEPTISQIDKKVADYGHAVLLSTISIKRTNILNNRK